MEQTDPVGVIVEVRAVIALELDSIREYDREGMRAEVRAWLSQFGPVREFELSDDRPDTPVSATATPARPRPARRPPKILAPVAVPQQPEPATPQRQFGVIAESTALGEINEESQQDAPGPARRRRPAQQRRGRGVDSR